MFVHGCLGIIWNLWFYSSTCLFTSEKQIWVVNSDGISLMLREEWDPAHWKMSLALFETEERLLVLLKRKYGSFISLFRHVKKEPNWFFLTVIIKIIFYPG